MRTLPQGHERLALSALSSWLNTLSNPGCAGHAKGSLFHGRDIPMHIEASWGGFELVDIAKELFRAALTDTANQKMVLLSESCLPLYPATLTYAQLISEPKSRINACRDPVRSPAALVSMMLSTPSWQAGSSLASHVPR